MARTSAKSKKSKKSKSKSRSKSKKVVKKTKRKPVKKVARKKPATLKRSTVRSSSTVGGAEVVKQLKAIVSAVNNCQKTMVQLSNGAAIALDEQAEVAAATTTTKKKTTRKTKKAAIKNAAAAAEADPFAVQTSNKSGVATVSKDQVVEALQTVSATFGLPKVKEILTRFKADRVSSLKEEDYALFVQHCKELKKPADGAPASDNFLS